MTFFDRVVASLFPQTLLEGTPWLETWREKERKDFTAVARVAFPSVALLYFAHYWFFDLPMKLEPWSYWLVFRLSMVSVALASFVYYLYRPEWIRAYRLVAMLAAAVFCVSQSWVTVIYPPAPWLYCFVFVMISAWTLKASPIKSCIFATFVIILQWPGLMAANLSVPEAVSATVVTLLGTYLIRGGYLAEIRYFLLTQENLDTQRRNIELTMEFTDRIKFFVPKQIASRMEAFLEARDVSVVSAIHEVLRPQKRQIACLFSDIRGFTESSKDLQDFIGEKVLPNVKACTEAIEASGGIPRKIGDLVFAYFDHRRVQVNLLRALVAGLEIARLNEEQNAGYGSLVVKRYILISIGEAIVGNIGGFDSSVEITALGTPVNYLSRLDEATKHPELNKRIVSSDLVICSHSMELLRDMGVFPDALTIDLSEIGVTIRNFQDERFIYCLAPSERNQMLLGNAYSKLARPDSISNEDRYEAA